MPPLPDQIQQRPGHPLDGATLVITHEDNPKALARNLLEDRFSASAAIAGNELFLRGEQYLYSIADGDRSPLLR